MIACWLAHPAVLAWASCRVYPCHVKAAGPGVVGHICAQRLKLRALLPAQPVAASVSTLL